MTMSPPILQQRHQYRPQQKQNVSRRRRTLLQAVAAAALVVSAHAFATPQSHVSSRLQSHSSSLPMIDEATETTEFNLGLGKALDTLRSDYPDMLKKRPDYSIYHPDIVVVDPSGFKLNGISNYKQAFKLVHSIINVFYCPEKSLLTNRIVWDCTRNSIRVSWNAEVVPKKIFGGVKTTLHVDGISVYILNHMGKVVQHRVEHLMINDRPVETERGIFHALTNECDHPDCRVPVFYGEDVVRFTNPIFGPGSSRLFSPSKDDDDTAALDAMSASSDSGNNNPEHQYPGLDWDAFQRKNASRKKFGLDPITPEEFLEIEAQVQQMTAAQPARSDAAPSPRPEKKKKSILANLFGEAFEDTCESNFDCKRPQICCDFGFKKQCCSSGAMVGRMEPVRIPVTKDDGYNNGW